MTTQRKVVAVTGSSGYIGAKLLEHLEETPGRGKLVTFDTRPLRAPIHNIAAFRHDVATPIHEELSRHRVNTLVHLAFTQRRGPDRRDRAAVSERNRQTLRNILESCARAHIGHLIFLSSHTVYGARADSPVPLHEDSPLHPAPGSTYASDSYLAEQMLLEYSQAMPDMKLTIFRCCPALGPMAGMQSLRDFYFPGGLGLSDCNPPLQFVYDDDLARVLCLAITEELTGIFNVAGDGVAFLRELAEAMPARQTRLPAALVYPLKRMAGGGSPIDHDLARWPIIMSTAKLHQSTGYRFRHTAQDAVAALASSSYEAQQLPSNSVESL